MQREYVLCIIFVIVSRQSSPHSAGAPSHAHVTSRCSTHSLQPHLVILTHSSPLLTTLLVRTLSPHIYSPVLPRCANPRSRGYRERQLLARFREAVIGTWYQDGLPASPYQCSIDCYYRGGVRSCYVCIPDSTH